MMKGFGWTDPTVWEAAERKGLKIGVSTLRPPPVIAALLTRMSRRPHRPTTSSMQRWHSSRRVMSPTNAAPVPPTASMRATVDAARSADTSNTATFEPCFANRTAIATPMPGSGPLPPAPVTIATLPDEPSRGVGRARDLECFVHVDLP